MIRTGTFGLIAVAIPAAAGGLGLLPIREGDRAGALEALRRAGERASGEVADMAKAAMLDLAGTEGER